jgi:glucose/arabinose dehydrogenase
MSNSTLLRTIVLLICMFYTTLFSSTVHAQPVLGFTPLAAGLSSPVDVVNAADGTNRMFIVERGGTIKAYDASFNLLGNFLTVTGITSGGERGLLSLAFHPDYENNRYFFVYYTNAAGDVEIARYRTPAGTPNVADPASKTIIMTILKTTGESNHNGGKLNFGPDGQLYFAPGDGGGAGDPNNLAQRKDRLLGKMVRINVNNFTTPPYYTVPADNPSALSTDTLPEIYAFGLRNPWRWSFDRSTGDMWIADVGQGVWEEINFTAAGDDSLNYGWHCYEGTANYSSNPACPVTTKYTTPIFQYPHNNATGGFAVTGGYVYRGTQFPSLVGYYVCADYISDNVWLIRPNGSGWQVIQQSGLPGAIAAFGETEAGEMVALSLDAGTVYSVAVSGSLPVTLISFTAKAQPGYTELQWKTTREIDVQKYTVEYSTDGVQWLKAGDVAPLTGQATPEYYFKHSIEVNGRLFYRLDMIDRDGSHAYSRIITTNALAGQGNELKLFPAVNSYGQLQVQLNEPFASLQVINMYGQKLITRNLQNQSGIFRLNTSGFSKGTYIVVASRAGKTVSKTFVIP